MLTCKQFLAELNEYLDETTAAEVRRELEAHLEACPNCWVICDTTRKTIQFYRGAEPYPVPADVHARLMKALEKKVQG